MANIKSFGDLGESDSDGPEDDGFNDYYAGGEKSGQLIRGAPKQDNEDAVASMFQRAKQAGAQQGTAADLQPQAPAQASSTFAGTGRTLAGGSSSAAQSAAGASDQQPSTPNYIITFWANGVFTVNDGPPRSVTDPANRVFMECISRGECPPELEPAVPGMNINVNLVRSGEDYKPPTRAAAPVFQGTGRTLAGNSGAGGAGSSAARAAAVQGEWAGVDDSKPTTSIQLRMADGSRMVAKFNHSHHISDIRRFIRASRPDVTFAYSLMTGVPPQPLGEEPDKTLEEAGLLNSVVIQRK